MDRDELKETFHRVNAYRHICNAVRRSANNTLFHGFVFAVIAAWIGKLVGTSHWLFMLYAGLATVEFGIGLWKKFAPSVECVLVDALNSFAFGASFVGRFILAWQGVIRFRHDPIDLFIGCWVLWGAWRQFGAYRQLCRAFVQRPTGAQMRYVAEMIRDIRSADPEEDNTALDLPSDPPIQALLADELAFIVDAQSGDALALDRDAVTLRREPPTQELPPFGWLSLEGNGFAPFPLSDANWRNYLRWKGESAGS